MCAQIWGLFAGFACARTGLWGLFTREIECGPHAREAAPVLFQYPPVAPPAWILLVGARKKLAYSYSFSKCEYEYALAVLNNSSTVVLPCTVGTSYICWLICTGSASKMRSHCCWLRDSEKLRFHRFSPKVSWQLCLGTCSTFSLLRRCFRQCRDAQRWGKYCTHVPPQGTDIRTYLVVEGV